MAHSTILRGQRELRRQWSAQGERQLVLERQRLEREVPASSRISETCCFSSLIWGSFLF